ncbi:MAG: phosphatase PAP2 family protein [Bacteroidetes bacterium]|nr:phosphatase PAP2 family protein [Bacteroidota bacterium]
MYQKLLIGLLAGIIFPLCSIAQEIKKETTPETKAEKVQEKKLYSISQFVHESYLFVQQPTKWKGMDWLKLGLVVGTTASIMTLDQYIINSTQGQQRFYYSLPIVGGRVYGEWYAIGGVAGTFGLYGLIASNNSAKKISIELLQAGIYSELATIMLKIVIGRARPLTGETAFSYRPFTVLDDDFHSMPSGHTTSAMALSTVMSRHAHKTVFKILAYAPAAFTMFSRIYQDKHWLSDEVIAASIGYFVGNWVVDLHEGKRHRINVTSVYPTTRITVSLDKLPPKMTNPRQVVNQIR